MNIDISQFTSTFEKIRPMPWKPMVWVITSSFIVASIASTAIGYLIMGQTTPSIPIQANNVGDGFTWSSSSTLTKGEIDKILDRNLFNSAGLIGDVDPNSNAGTNRPGKTSLPVKVVGLIYGGNPFVGLAMIENTEKKSVNSFLVGDPLTADATATVKEIHQTEIIIDNQGRLEFAPLEEPEIRRSSRAGKKPAKKTESNTSLGGSGFATEPPPENYKEEGFERKGVSIEMTQEYKTRLLTVDFASVLQDAKASPNVVNGVLKGWKLDRIRKGSIYEKAGVQNNDVIEEINGVMLSDAAQAVKTLQQLKNEDSIELRLIRNGQPININFKVR